MKNTSAAVLTAVSGPSTQNTPPISGICLPLRASARAMRSFTLASSTSAAGEIVTPSASAASITVSIDLLVLETSSPLLATRTFNSSANFTIKRERSVIETRSLRSFARGFNVRGEVYSLAVINFPLSNPSTIERINGSIPRFTCSDRTTSAVSDPAKMVQANAVIAISDLNVDFFGVVFL